MSYKWCQHWFKKKNKLH